MIPTDQYAVGLNGVLLHVKAFDRDDAIHRALRKRYGFRTRLIGDDHSGYQVARVGHHGRVRKVLLRLESLTVDVVRALEAGEAEDTDG